MEGFAMTFEQLITDRYSVRSFKNEHLPQEVIDKLLEAAHKAPTGCNYQPQRILVMNTDDSISKLQTCTRCHFGAPTAMLICHNKQESWKRKYDDARSSPVDAVIVATYLMLAAQNEGVGTCMVMHFDPTAMRETFSIPAHIESALLLVMGYPSEDAKPIEMHFKKRPLTETVVYDTF